MCSTDAIHIIRFFLDSPLQTSLHLYKNAAKVRAVENKLIDQATPGKYNKKCRSHNISFRGHPSHQNVSEEDVCVQGIMKGVKQMCQEDSERCLNLNFCDVTKIKQRENFISLKVI